MTTKEYLQEKLDRPIDKNTCPGDFGLDCPVKKWGEDCPKDTSKCWSEEITENNKSYIAEYYI